MMGGWFCIHLIGVKLSPPPGHPWGLRTQNQFLLGELCTADAITFIIFAMLRWLNRILEGKR